MHAPPSSPLLLPSLAAPPKTPAGLAQNRLFDDPAFVSYLSYLQYWRQPAYAAHLTYPHALPALEALQSREFRAAMKSAATAVRTRPEDLFCALAGGRWPARAEVKVARA